MNTNISSLKGFPMHLQGFFKSAVAATLAIGLAATSANASSVYDLTFNGAFSDGISVTNSSGGLPVPGSTSSFSGTLDLASVDFLGAAGAASAASDMLVNNLSTNPVQPTFATLTGSIDFSAGIATGGSILVTDDQNETYTATITGGFLTDDGTDVKFDGMTLGSFSSNLFTGQSVKPTPAELRGLVLIFRFSASRTVSEMQIQVSDAAPGNGVTVPLPASLWAGLVLLSGCGATRVIRRKIA
jgi:hypothetical protein